MKIVCGRIIRMCFCKMFIRIKKIKGIEYAYLVKSAWKDNAAQQKVVKYLGRVYTPQKISQLSFEEFCQMENISLSNAEYKEYITALMAWSLYQHGFRKDTLVQKKWLLSQQLVAEPEKFKVFCKKKEITIKLNDGYMNLWTLNELANIQLSKTEEQRQSATILANAFLTVGIQIPQNIFIELFQKLYQ